MTILRRVQDAKTQRLPGSLHAEFGGSPLLQQGGAGLQSSGKQLTSQEWALSLRCGRDDNSSWKLYLAFPNKIVIPTGAEGSAVRPSDFPNSGVLTQTL
jgi:hypothetical protein